MEELYSKTAGLTRGEKDGSFEIEWIDGTTTKHWSVPTKPICKNCRDDVFQVTFVQYHGFCSPCFGELAFGMPGKLNSDCGAYIWRRPVDQTSDTEGFMDREIGADFLGNNFGVGDIVLYDPRRDREKRLSRREEGTVLAIYEYQLPHQPRYNTFLTRTHFGGGVGVTIPARSLEALTCDHLDIDMGDFEGLLDDVPSQFDPREVGEDMAKVFHDDIARAIWMSYRLNHLVDDAALDKLTRFSFETAKKLRGAKLSRERVHLWLKKKLRMAGFQMEDPQVAALVPYLVGERTSSFHLEEAVAGG